MLNPTWSPCTLVPSNRKCCVCVAPRAATMTVRRQNERAETASLRHERGSSSANVFSSGKSDSARKISPVSYLLKNFSLVIISVLRLCRSLCCSDRLWGNCPGICPVASEGRELRIKRANSAVAKHRCFQRLTKHATAATAAARDAVVVVVVIGNCSWLQSLARSHWPNPRALRTV